MYREMDRMIVKHVLKVPKAIESESFLDGWLENQNYYSTQLEDAHKIVKHFEKIGETVEVETSTGGKTRVSITEHKPYGKLNMLKDIHTGRHNSAPFAICIAALSYYGVGVNIKKVEAEFNKYGNQQEEMV